MFDRPQVILTELRKQVNSDQRSHVSLTSFRFFRPAQNFVAHTKPKETFVVSTKIVPIRFYIDPDVTYVFVLFSFGVLGRLGKESFSSFPH